MIELAGHLGMTVSELRWRMSQDELNLWVAYVEENGPLNSMLRIEAAVARAVSPFLKGVKPKDLMIYPREQEQPASIETVFALFKSKAAENRKN